MAYLIKIQYLFHPPAPSSAVCGSGRNRGLCIRQICPDSAAALAFSACLSYDIFGITSANAEASGHSPADSWF